MTTRAKYIGGVLTEYDSVTSEMLSSAHAVQLWDDFLGAGHSAGVPAAASPVAGYPWVKKIVGTGPPTVAIVSNGAQGQMQCALTATSEKQDAALYANDNLTFDMSKGGIFEARVKLSVLPSAAGVQWVCGLQSAWIDGPDNASFYMQFAATANGAILFRTKDGVTTNSFASGVTVLTTDWHIYRIDASDVTNVQFYIDGNQIATATLAAFAATGANAILQPYMSVYKASGTGLATAIADYFKVNANRV